MKKISRWHKMNITNTLTSVIFIYTFYTQFNLMGLMIIIVIFIINIWMHIDFKCPSCGYMIDRSRLGPVATFPDEICRCGQDKRKDEAESAQIRAERIQKEKTRGW